MISNLIDLFFPFRQKVEEIKSSANNIKESCESIKYHKRKLVKRLNGRIEKAKGI